MTEGRSPRKLLRGVALFLPMGSLATGSTIAATLLLNAVSGILIARLLGPFGKGALALAFIWSGLGSQLADTGISQALTFYASREPERRATLWGQGLVIAGVQSAVVVPLAILASRFVIHSSSVRLAVGVALLSVPLSLALGYELSLLIGAQQFKSYNAIRLGQAVGWTSVVITFTVLSVRSPIGLVVAFSIVLLACILVAGILLWRRLGWPKASREGASALFRYGLLVWVSGIGHQTNSRIDQLILGSVVAASALGQYAAAVSFASLLTIASMGIATVTLPEVARAKGSDALTLGRRNVLIGFGLMCVGAVLLALLAPIMVTGLLGQSFRPAVPLLRVLLIAQVALGTTQIVHEVARGQGRLKFPAAVETAGALATLIMLLYAVPRWGALGAAWVSVAAYWLVAVVLCEGILGRVRGRGSRGEVGMEVAAGDIVPPG